MKDKAGEESLLNLAMLEDQLEIEKLVAVLCTLGVVRIQISQLSTPSMAKNSTRIIAIKTLLVALLLLR